jgi:cell division ATPase FtsA
LVLQFQIRKRFYVCYHPGLHGRPDKEISLKSLASIINARVEEILEMVNTELKAYGAYEQNVN